MTSLRQLLLVFAGLSGTLLNTAGFAQESERGKLLYGNNCLGCHESGVHIRTKRTVKAADELHFQVNRWAKHLNLGWRREEIRDVSRYLNQRFYKFNSKP